MTNLLKGAAPLELIRARATWEQGKHGGLLGAARNRLNRTDVDFSAIVYAEAEPVDYVFPKTRESAQDGAVVHAGDAKSADGDGEEITIRLSTLDSDITAVAFVLSCASGSFDKITNTRVTFADQAGETLHRKRLSVTTTYNGATIGFVRRTGAADWTFVESARYGNIDYAKWASGEAWRDLSGIATRAVTGR